jgi:D-alanyl-D-alanine dipeptidase
MGSGFDCFLPISQPCLEKEHLQSGALTQAHLDNRHVLRGAMTEAGFHPIPNEWWHFDALHRKEIRDVYRIIE